MHHCAEFAACTCTASIKGMVLENLFKRLGFTHVETADG